MQENTVKNPLEKEKKVPFKVVKRDTVYAYSEMVQGTFEEQEMISCEKLKEFFTTHKYGQIEQIILLTLDKYKYLNNANMEYILSLKLPSARQKKSYQNNLRQMVKDGVLGCYKLGFDTTSKNTLCAYYNLEVVSEYLEKPKRILSRSDCTILERLSLNQWHIHAEQSKNVQRAEYYPKFDEENEVYKIPSLLSIPLIPEKRQNKNCPTAYIGAYPAPKGVLTEENELLFAKRLHNALSLLCKRKNSHEFGAIVLICDSKEQMKQLAGILEKYEELDEDCILYILDLYTQKNEPLKHLYHCRKKKQAFITSKVQINYLASSKMK